MINKRPAVVLISEFESLLNLSELHQNGAKELPITSRAFCCWDINFRQPAAAAKFIIKSSLFLLKFKDAGHAETEDWICF